MRNLIIRGYLNRCIRPWWILLLFISASSSAQQNCLPNIGFENGTLDGWACTAGFIQMDGTLILNPTPPVFGRHTIFANSNPQELDPYGFFPVNCPNGSKYSIRLGNSSAGGQAEGISYTFTIPADRNDFGIIYNYAVVLQNPPHQPWEQPRFTSRVFNVTDNQYMDCASFQFIAAADLPGFSAAADSVFYKPWSPVTVNLSGLAGKTVRLEFTTNDCAFVKHFGYAYIDVNEDCNSSAISGNIYCGGSESITLTAPFGFASYQWYTSDFSTLLGTSNILKISPAPPPNTVYAVIIAPYPGQGCADTLYTTIKYSNEPLKLNVIDSISGCSTTGIDLTDTAITSGSSSGLTYSYFEDINEINYVPVPSHLTRSGTYYIKGTNSVGCSDIRPVKVTISDAPQVNITPPPDVCTPQKVDITLPQVTAGSEPGLTLSYWSNLSATIPLANPRSIANTGTYYIKAVNTSGCGGVFPVVVKIGFIPNPVIHNPVGCGNVNITLSTLTTGSPPGLTFTYWTDGNATIPLTNAASITSSGVYFIKATTDTGCSIVKPVSVIIDPVPDFTVTDPPAVAYPVMTVDITSAVSHNNGLTYTYYTDSFGIRSVAHPTAVDKRGIYYIKGANEYGCYVIKPVNVVIIPPPSPIVYIPNAFSPNNDGLNDVFRIKIIGETSINHFRIYSRWGQIVYDDPDLSHSWDGKFKGADMPLGVYIWTLDGFDTYYQKHFTQKGIVTLVR